MFLNTPYGGRWYTGLCGYDGEGRPPQDISSQVQ